jgi:hypothetical protein
MVGFGQVEPPAVRLAMYIKEKNRGGVDGLISKG